MSSRCSITSSSTGGNPKRMRVDNSPEYAGCLVDQWAYLNGVELDFSRPGTPTDNALIEAFNSSVSTLADSFRWLGPLYFLSNFNQS
jgi:transposase InsO family protein